jgi:hypothetical protein
MVSPVDVERIDAIMGGAGDHFTAQLLRLIGKADMFNRERMRIAFPDEVALYERWLNQ